MDSGGTEDAWSVASCRRQDLYPASAGGPAPAPLLSPAAAFPGPITRRGLEEACQAQRHHLQAATQTGTLLDNGQRPGRLRRHIELGLAIAQTLLGQKNTVHRSQCEFHGRQDTRGNEVCYVHGYIRHTHARFPLAAQRVCPTHLPRSVPVALSPRCDRDHRRVVPAMRVLAHRCT